MGLQIPAQCMLIVLALLGGCVSGGATKEAEPSGPAPAAQFDADSGAIAGSILDPEGLPIAGAMVALLETQLAAQSDAEGRFTISNVPPGDYNLAAQHLGYESAARRVTIVAGEVLEATFVLNAIAMAKEAYSHSFTVEGYFECSYQAGNKGPCFFPVIGTNTSVIPIDPWTNNKRQFDYSVYEGTMTVLNEMTWTQTSAATGDQMSVFLSYQKRSGQHWYCDAASTSPIYLRWDRGEIDDKEGTCLEGDSQLPSSEPKTIPVEGQILTSRANTGPSNQPGLQQVGFGMALQQSFEITISAFYWEAAPEGYSALPDN